MVEQSSNDTSSKLIFKFPLSNPLFLEYDMISEWEFSKTILITAFDLLKDERLIIELQKNGLSLKEYLQERGFNKDVKILCDTGIFEYEIRKAKLEKEIPVDVNSFSTDDIFWAYELIEPDFLVAPDEIILQSDSEDTIKGKISQLEQNLKLTIDSFPKEKIIAVLHGFSNDHLTRILNFITREGIKKVARGGLIPLWTESKEKFREVVRLSETLAREKGIEYLHSFGLPALRVIKDYFYFNSYDTLDTSVLYYRTAQKKFLINKGYFISVRYAHFDRCGCKGCNLMSNNVNKTNSGNFVVGLYYHNCMMLNKLVKRLLYEPNIFQHPKNRLKKRKGAIFSENITSEDQKSLASNFISADTLIPPGSSIKRPVYIKKSYNESIKIPLKILLISSCSKTKTISSGNILSLNDLKTKEQRKKILESATNLLEARNLYNSKRIDLVKKLFKDLQAVCLKTELFFLSAGFGIIHESTKIPPYDVSFGKKSDEEIKKMAEDLEINTTINRLPDQYDIIFLDLSRPYVKALEPLSTFLSKTRELVLFGQETNLSIPKIVQLNEYELMELDGRTNYFSFRIHENIRASVLKNFFLYLINQDVLGKFTSFKAWIENILQTGYQNQFYLRAI